MDLLSNVYVDIAPRETIVAVDRPSSAPESPAGPHVEVIIPTLDEEARLVPSLRRIAEYLAEQDYGGAIAVVDNGSTDRTPDLAYSCSDVDVPVRVIGCAKRGKGAAVRRGVLTSKARYVGFSDADLATPIETLDEILRALESGSQVAIASRRCPGSIYTLRQPLKRRLASYAFRSAVRASTRRVLSVHDTQCGFKFFEADAARWLFRTSTATGFAFDVEILALAAIAGYQITEVPAHWRHRHGSTLNLTRDANGVLTELLTVRRNLNVQLHPDSRIGFRGAQRGNASESRR